jgi:hypothetical protein
MWDIIGQEVKAGDILAYAQRGGDTSKLTIGVVLNSGTKEVIGLNTYGWLDDKYTTSSWIPRTKSGKLNNYDRAIKIKPSMIADSELRQAVSDLCSQYGLGE